MSDGAIAVTHHQSIITLSEEAASWYLEIPPAPLVVSGVDRIPPAPLAASGVDRIPRALLAASAADPILPAPLAALADGATALDCCGSRR